MIKLVKLEKKKKLQIKYLGFDHIQHSEFASLCRSCWETKEVCRTKSKGEWPQFWRCLNCYNYRI